MTNPEPSPSPDYDIHELFREELGSDQEAVKEPEEPSNDLQDEDRLYTDEFMRQNEQASRFLLWSVLFAGAISIGIGGWYLFTRTPSQSQPAAPLQVPAQPPIAPLSSPNLNSPLLPTSPNSPGQKIPATDSGIVPNTLPNGNPTLPTQILPNSAGTDLTPPPPPETP